MSDIDQQHQVQPQSFWFVGKAAGVDCYATMGVAAQFGWRAIESWGSRGWHLGAWPVAMIYHRDRSWPDSFELVEWIEGDVTMWSFPTRELRDAVTDQLAFGYWKQMQRSWVHDITVTDDMPDFLRGPYSPERSQHATQLE